MRRRRAHRAIVFGILSFILSSPVFGATILFDATKHEMAGNADWVIDADAWSLNLPAYPCTGNTNESNPGRFPSPPQGGITPATPETFWTGGISSWGIELAKAGHTVETLPPGAAITYGNAGNPQDLTNYQLFIAVEPQVPFTVAEKAAILAFVNAGGGLFMVGDHETSDRDCDGWDSPHVWDDLMGATSSASTGLFGIWFRYDGTQTKPSEDWFDDGVDSNTETNPADPIIFGPFGSGAGGLGLFGATSMDLNPADNPTVLPHVWRTGQPHNNLRVTFATASYGLGRVAAIGDSSPADDGTGDPSDTLYGGWDKAVGGVKNREIHLNACAWLLNPAPDTTPPSITAGPAAAPGDCSAVITWTTDEPATSVVGYGLSGSYGQNANVAGLTRNHSVTLSGLSSGILYHYKVSSADSAGNGPTQSPDQTFSTSAATAPVILTGPTATSVSGTSATIVWTTNEPSTSQVDYGTTVSYGSSASAGGLVMNHSVVLSPLTPTTDYHYRVLSTDSCGNGPTASGDGTFTSGPASIDVSGWILKQFTSTLAYTIPPGTTIPSGGYLVVGRDATRAAFDLFFPSMPPATVYLNSNANGSCANGCFPQINGGETYELWNPTLKIDGPTVAVASGNSYQRKNPGDPAGIAGSWNVVVRTSANPGQGAGTGSNAGVVLGELADATDYTKEFIELYYDSGISPADTTPPAAITNLSATPLGATSIRLDWTASGDDGTSGTAAIYDIRRSASPIRSESDFSAATPLSGEPAPALSGTAQQMTVSGLVTDTSYYFAMKVSDEVPNTSPLSNWTSATTGPVGGGSATHLVISQIQTNGDGGTPADDEFVEIYNPTASAVSLNGLSLQYKSPIGTSYSPFPLPNFSLGSNRWYLVARSAYNGTPAADATHTAFLMGAAGGNVFLVNGTAALPASSCSASALIIDKVAWGTGNCPETAVTTVPAANNSVVRKPGGSSGSGQDTDNNSSDFLSQVPSSPHNSTTTPAIPPGALGNVGNTLYLWPGASASELDWASAAAATGYRVYRGTTAGFLSGSPAPWQTSTPSATVDAASPSPIFYYVVRATDGTNESAN